MAKVSQTIGTVEEAWAAEMEVTPGSGAPVPPRMPCEFEDGERVRLRDQLKDRWMSAQSYEENVRIAAREAVKTAGAVRICPWHPEVTIRVGNANAEHYAYALATTALKHEGAMEARQDVLEAIKAELDGAADGACPRCGWRAPR
jgi:hypothetical protein